MITRREPQLSTQFRKHGLWQISPRRLATMLNTLSPDKISLPAASAALYHDDFGVRYNAARTLSLRGDRDARLIMLEALQKGEVRTRASVARHLTGFSWFSATTLIDTALVDTEAPVREAAIYALCDFAAQAGAYQKLAEALTNEHDDDVRLAASVGLRDRQDPDAVPVLAAVLRARDPEVRIAALQALGANHTPSAVPVVETSLLTDSNPTVVYEATLSYVELLEDKALPTLIEAIRHHTKAFRGAVIRGLFHASNYMQSDLTDSPHCHELIEALIIALNDPIARFDAIYPLIWIRLPETTTLLQTAYYDSTDIRFKVHIVRIAWALMAESRETLLMDALNDPALRPEVEELAARQDVYLTFDAAAEAGTGLRNPVLGR